jgi:hypothetical protein
VFFTKYYQDDHIKETEMDEACSIHGELRNVYKVLVGKPEGRRSLGRPRCRQEDNIKMDLWEIGSEGVD